MKKKVLTLLLAVSCAIALTACGGSKETATEAEETKEAPVETAEPEETEEDKAAKEQEEKEKKEKEAKEQAEKEAKEQAEKEKEAAEKAKEEEKKNAANAPSELSDDLYDFQVSINGDVYQIPMWYSDFEALGWEYDGDNTETLSSNQYTTSQRWKKDGFSIYTRFANLSMNSVTFADSMIGGIALDKYDLKDCDWEILLPGGIEWGVSNADDIRAAYGDPTDDYDGDMYYKMTYKYDSYREISLYVYKETDALEQIDIQNLVELEGADNSVDESVPDVVKDYKAPSELGDDLYSFNVELEGNLYTLPCPVSEFLANGFTIDESNSDMEVAAGSFGWVDLKYNNQTLHAMADNYADYATVMENCFVTDVKSSDFGPEFELVIPGNIKRGDAQADVEKALEGFNVEKETSDSGFTYYTIYDPDGSKLNRYEVCVQDGVVIQIEVKNDELPE